jgi:hypothetical protein
MKNKGNEGLIITSILFITLISFIGISILSSTIFHTKIIGAREKRSIDVNFLNANLIKYLHNFREKIYLTNLNKFNSVSDDFFNTKNFHDKRDGAGIVKNKFNNIIKYKNKYSAVIINDRVISSSNNIKLKLEAIINIDILSGNIPISKIPLYISNQFSKSKESFLADNKIKVNFSGFFTKKDVRTNLKFNNFLTKFLQLEGCILNWKSIRKSCGIEISDMPLPIGVYPFFNKVYDNRLEGVFIQGDVQKIMFSTEDNRQKLIITQSNKEYLIEYEPKKYNLKYWGSEFEEIILFKEKIIINGNVYSLISNEEFAFLNTTDMCLYASGIVYINSSLSSNDSLCSNLKIITGSNQFFKKTKQSGQIIINNTNTGTPTRLSISVIATERLINKASDTAIIGSIYTKELNNKGCLRITGSNRTNGNDVFFTTEKFTFIKDFNFSLNGEVYYD